MPTVHVPIRLVTKTRYSGSLVLCVEYSCPTCGREFETTAQIRTPANSIYGEGGYRIGSRRYYCCGATIIPSKHLGDVAGNHRRARNFAINLFHDQHAFRLKGRIAFCGKSYTHVELLKLATEGRLRVK